MGNILTARWVDVLEKARHEAEAIVERLAEAATQRERSALASQGAAARLRLQRKLGRYLVCLGHGASNLNEIFYHQMQRDIAGRYRLQQCYKKLGYPDWPADMVRDLEEFVARLGDNQRRARLLGTEIDAALEDPRWAAQIIE